MIYEFRDRDDITEQVLRPKQTICAASLETRITRTNKPKRLIRRRTSSKTAGELYLEKRNVLYIF